MTQTETALFFDTYSAQFDAIYGNRNSVINTVLNRLFRKSMKVRYLKSLQGCEPVKGRTVLDVGCGPGHYAVSLAKREARAVVGLDFAERMIQLGRRHAEVAGVREKCEFIQADFLDHSFHERFDYCILMGFMDYISQPEKVIQKTYALTKERAFFSFPIGGTFLAWQRQLRYRNRCPLFLYRSEDVRTLFAESSFPRFDIEPIHRDFFVTAYAKESEAI
jgi:2-polyprenyl-3-methyl-5-hydroxy-6-metoxy-1,4-benzoquinol methylase